MIIGFKSGTVSFDAEFDDSDAALEIIESLPLKSTVSTWGDEIYFDTGMDISSAGSTTDVNVGDVAYWPQGKCLCVFFGPTLASSSDKPVPASPVVILGKTSALPAELKKIKPGTKISVFLKE